MVPVPPVSAYRTRAHRPLAQLLQERKTLMLGYTEDMAESVGLEDSE